MRRNCAEAVNRWEEQPFNSFLVTVSTQRSGLDPMKRPSYRNSYKEESLALPTTQLPDHAYDVGIQRNHHHASAAGVNH